MPTPVQQLLAQQAARFADVDPLLPGTPQLPSGDPVTAKMPDGGPVAGILVHTSHPPGSFNRLWSAAEVFELHPLVGEYAGEGMDVLLSAWRDRMTELPQPPRDSACLVTWPSQDVACARALLDHGFVPLSCLAVRPPHSPNTKLSGTVKVRRAEQTDLEEVVRLAYAELEYSALVGSSTRRPDARELKRNVARVHLASGDPVWLAERDDECVGLAECGWTDTTTHWTGSRLPGGLWGYVNCVSVTPEARGSGVGQQLMAVAHDHFQRADTVGTYLYYNPPNPLSSVFWPRQGYQPLWTLWELRPATALR